MTANAQGVAAPPSSSQIMLECFLVGMRVDVIASEFEIGPEQVEKTLGEELRNLTVRPAEHFVKFQLARIERLLGVLAMKSEKGDLKAIEVYLRALDRAERLYGFLKRVASEDESAAKEDRAIAEKVTRLMLTENPKLFSEKT